MKVALFTMLILSTITLVSCQLKSKHSGDKCEECDGSGIIRSECDECDGDGKVNCPECDGDGELGQCFNCSGKGYDDCMNCRGRG